jgi:hypothetical protein
VKSTLSVRSRIVPVMSPLVKLPRAGLFEISREATQWLYERLPEDDGLVDAREQLSCGVAGFDMHVLAAEEQAVCAQLARLVGNVPPSERTSEIEELRHFRAALCSD